MSPAKSCILATCQQCKAVYEVAGLQSVYRCERCHPIKRCAHGVKVTEPCKTCIRVHGNQLLRVM